jgi:uncharacterized membrane protein YkvA (DUF1232 family)
MLQDTFIGKLGRIATAAGADVVEKALQLFYALRSPGTPTSARRVILGALAYLLLPADMVPDWLPVIGFTEDLGILTAALVAVNRHVTDDMVLRARATRQRWFGADGLQGANDTV